jgi:hypothetical protein
LAHDAGLRHAYVNSVERGERSVGIDEIELLARAFGIEWALPTCWSRRRLIEFLFQSTQRR